MATQANWIRVAAAPKTFQQSLGCGMCLEITGTGEGSGHNPIKGKRKAVIVDECASGCGQSKTESAVCCFRVEYFVLCLAM